MEEIGIQGLINGGENGIRIAGNLRDERNDVQNLFAPEVVFGGVDLVISFLISLITLVIFYGYRRLGILKLIFDC